MQNLVTLAVDDRISAKKARDQGNLVRERADTVLAWLKKYDRDGYRACRSEHLDLILHWSALEGICTITPADRLAAAVQYNGFDPPY